MMAWPPDDRSWAVPEKCQSSLLAQNNGHGFDATDSRYKSGCRFTIAGNPAQGHRGISPQAPHQFHLPFIFLPAL